MAMTATERVRAVRERRRRREIQVTVVLHQDDLGEIARRGYEGAASTDRARQGEADRRAMAVCEPVMAYGRRANRVMPRLVVVCCAAPTPGCPQKSVQKTRRKNTV